MKPTGNNILKLYQKIKQQRPIIHCITNAVTVNDCANILLAQVRPQRWRIIRWRWKKLQRAHRH